MSNDTTSMLELCLEQLRNGDDAARNEILRLSQRRLKLHTRRMFQMSPSLKPLLETGDVLASVQMRLDRALRNLPNVHSARSFFKLAAKHVRYALIDIHRSYFRKGSLKIPMTEQPNPDGSLKSENLPNTCDSDDPSNLLVLGEIHEKIQQLPQEEREVVDLHWYQGLTQREVAQILDTSTNSVEWLWLKARRRLGRWLRDIADFE
ncbi:MAG: RNA polymerase sigma factor [Gemmataceae bacterium]